MLVASKAFIIDAALQAEIKQLAAVIMVRALAGTQFPSYEYVVCDIFFRSDDG
jgi:hypothetical protein